MGLANNRLDYLGIEKEASQVKYHHLGIPTCEKQPGESISKNSNSSVQITKVTPLEFNGAPLEYL